MKMNLLVMYGGVSCEHDISVITALQAMSNLDENKYNIVPIYITKSGKWLTGDILKKVEYYNTYNKKSKVHEVSVLPNDEFLYKFNNGKLKKMLKIDSVLMCFHGVNGEDGSVSALFQLNSIPYTACAMGASALCCDKVSFKYYVKGLGIEQANFMVVNETMFFIEKELTIEKIEGLINYPLIIKPSRLGSSIGISVAYNKKELINALELGFDLDDQVLVEEFLEDITEINCAVLGFGNDILVSELEEPIKTSKILSFENKYIDTSSKAGGMESLTRKMPPNIDADTYKKITDTSKMLFTKMNMKGVIRIDYIIALDGRVLVNEINTIPGSLSNYLFKPKNITYSKLLDKLIALSFVSHNALQQKIKTFNSDVLKNLDKNFSLNK